MKILLIENANLSTQLALSSRLLSFSKYLSDQGDEVLLLTGSENNYEINGVKIIGCNSSTYSASSNAKFVFNSIKAIKKMKDIDIIHTFQPNLSANAPVYLSKMKKKLNFKVINDIRSLWIEMGLAKLNLSKQKGVPIRKILYQMEKIFFKIVDYYFFITIDHKKHYEEMLGQKFPASLIIPNALENFQITEKLDNKKKNEKVIFGYIGALQEMRGLRKIFNTFCDIEGVVLHLYGTPKIKNLPKNVYYKGYVDYKDIFNVLSSFDVGLAHVSNQDNYWYQMITSMRAYPRKIIEYMAATLPILASNQIAHTKTFNDLPLFYKENDEADLRDKIIMLRDNEKLRKRKGSEGYEFFVNNYSLNVIGSKIRRVYKHLIDG